MRVLIVGAGHNGLVCACYLARAGLDVCVLEQSNAPGGGSRTEQTIRGYRFDTHSVAHNIINMTSIPRELQLADAGLQYLEMDPFAVAFFADGRRVRFHRSIEQTVASIAEHNRSEAVAYERFMADGLPLIDLLTLGLRGFDSRRLATGALLRRLPDAAAVLRRNGAAPLASDLLGSYGRLLRSRLPADLTRGPVAAFAAHAGASSTSAGGSLFAWWQAAYHRYGQWHARGGAGALTGALVRRLGMLGGELRCDALVTAIRHRGGRVQEVFVGDEERLTADVVVTATDPEVAFGLLEPPLRGRVADELAATHRSGAVQAVVHVAVDRLPPYADARPGDWNGLQSYVDSLENLEATFAAAGARRLHRPAAGYAFTTSALDDTLAPPGHHTVYLACPAAPFDVAGGWRRCAPRLVEDLLNQVEARAPGFRDTIREVVVRTPEQMARELRWPGAHPMHLDPTPDQLGLLRPTGALGAHRTPISGLYLTGAGTSPVGGVAGAPGRAAAAAVLKDSAR